MPVDFRGATVEDLQLSPALVLPTSTSIGSALQLAFERDFSILPLHAPTSRASLLGWLSIDELKPLVERGEIHDLDAPLESLQEGEGRGGGGGGGAGGAGPVKQFRRSRKYEVITPSTPLESLDAFFQSQPAEGTGFALVTDGARKFVLGLVTREDLAKFIDRRFPSSSSIANAAETSKLSSGGAAPPVGQAVRV